MAERVISIQQDPGKIPGGSSAKVTILEITRLRGLPVVNIADGREFGRIQSCLVDTGTWHIRGFLLSGGADDAPPPALPFSSVRKFGMFAATVAGENSVAPLPEFPDLQEIADTSVEITGAEIFVSGDEESPAGFVREATGNPATGKLQVMKVCADSGFVLPLAAEVPFSDVAHTEAGRIVLKPGRTPKFERTKKADLRTSDGDIFVPLAVMDPEWRKALSARVSEEAEKLRGGLHKLLEADIRKHIPPDKSDAIKNELLETLSGFVRLETFDTLLKSLEKRMAGFSESIASSADKLESTLEKELPAFLEKKIAQVREQTDAALADLSGRISTMEADEFPSMIREEVTGLKNSLESRLAAAGTELDKKISVLADRLDELDLPSAVAREFSKAEAGLRSRLSEIEHRSMEQVSGLDTRLRELEAKSAAAMESLKERITQVEKEPPDPCGPAENFSDLLEETRQNMDAVQAELSDSIDEMRELLESSLNQVREEVDTTATGLFDGLAERLKKLERRAEESEPQPPPTAAPPENLREIVREEIQGLKEELARELTDSVGGNLKAIINATAYPGRAADPEPAPPAPKPESESATEPAPEPEPPAPEPEPEPAPPTPAHEQAPEPKTPASLRPTLAEQASPEPEIEKSAPPAPPEATQPPPEVESLTILPPPPAESAESADSAESPGGVLNKYEKMLLGKKAKNDIALGDGEFVVRKGEIIDENVIRRAKDAGRLFELSQNLSLY